MDKLSEGSGKICVIGERAISLGFRLIGISDSYEYSGKQAVEKLEDLSKSSKYSVIFVSETVKKYMDTRLLTYYESIMSPLIMFVPLPGEETEESLSAMAKRILGVDIGR
ncbi:MAG: V-type ATP synthase subunit F [Candidatus Thermoplasmatota archaeon]|jgi:V/A-type H+-transporting ATPase subunit F|nr:V-type ATP synthase subunit F [Candidatus Thermoplasmatota archaeon]